MKRLLILILTLALVTALAACIEIAPANDPPPANAPPEPPRENTPPDHDLWTISDPEHPLNDPYLVLVNAEYDIHEEFFDVVSVYGVVPAARADIMLNATALKALKEIFDEADTLGYTEFYLASGYRDYAAQAMLYEEAEDKSYVMPPGHSEHHTGLAADVAYLGENMYQFDSSAHGKWFMANAHRYGFILRYPEGKTHITGISYEPWHYRYVGKTHAKYMHENNLVLEEYVILINN
jgi:D-alanyl-D-alanine carboxypeptidase